MSCEKGKRLKFVIFDCAKSFVSDFMQKFIFKYIIARLSSNLACSFLQLYPYFSGLTCSVVGVHASMMQLPNEDGTEFEMNESV